MSKYHAQPTIVDGIRFDSKAEARRYGELLLLQRAGHIHELELQPPFELHVNGIMIGRYVADFRYLDEAGKYVVEDVKGVKTPMYRWKQKHMKAQYGIEIRETS